MSCQLCFAICDNVNKEAMLKQCLFCDVFLSETVCVDKKLIVDIEIDGSTNG